MNPGGLPVEAKIATLSQILMACLLATVWGAWASWGHSFSRGLMMSGVVFCPMFLLFVFAVAGLSKGKMFGWVTALFGTAVFGLVLLGTSAPLSLLPLVSFVVLLSRRVREFYSRNYYE